jgi:hypothetical protein
MCGATQQKLCISASHMRLILLVSSRVYPPTMSVVRVFEQMVFLFSVRTGLREGRKNCLFLNFINCRAPCLSGVLLCSGVCGLNVCYVMSPRLRSRILDILGAQGVPVAIQSHNMSHSTITYGITFLP